MYHTVIPFPPNFIILIYEWPSLDCYARIAYSINNEINRVVLLQ